MALLQPRKKAAVLKIIIIGCGKVGHTLAEQLSSEGHDIMIVDTNEALLRSVSESLDVMTVCGNGACLHVLEDAGLADADMVIAVTGSDELNLLCCIIARKAGGSIAVIARVRNPDYNDELIYLRQKLGLSLVINPEMEAAREISRIIARPQALTVSAFSKAQVELVRFQLPANNVLCGKSVKDMSELLHFGFLACAVERGGQVTIPDGSFVFQAGDELSVLASRRDVHRVFDSIGMHVEAARNCMMIGGGKSTYYLARMLLEQHVNVRIIEADAGRCAELSRLLPEATIIHGDGTDEDLLSEEGIQSMDAFVPLRPAWTRRTSPSRSTPSASPASKPSPRSTALPSRMCWRDSIWAAWSTPNTSRRRRSSPMSARARTPSAAMWKRFITCSTTVWRPLSFTSDRRRRSSACRCIA